MSLKDKFNKAKRKIATAGLASLLAVGSVGCRAVPRADGGEDWYIGDQLIGGLGPPEEKNSEANSGDLIAAAGLGLMGVGLHKGNLNALTMGRAVTDYGAARSAAEAGKSNIQQNVYVGDSTNRLNYTSRKQKPDLFFEANALDKSRLIDDYYSNFPDGFIGVKTRFASGEPLIACAMISGVYNNSNLELIALNQDGKEIGRINKPIRALSQNEVCLLCHPNHGKFPAGKYRSIWKLNGVYIGSSEYEVYEKRE